MTDEFTHVLMDYAASLGDAMMKYGINNEAGALLARELLAREMQARDLLAREMGSHHEVRDRRKFPTESHNRIMRAESTLPTCANSISMSTVGTLCTKSRWDPDRTDIFQHESASLPAAFLYFKFEQMFSRWALLKATSDKILQSFRAERIFGPPTNTITCKLIKSIAPFSSPKIDLVEMEAREEKNEKAGGGNDEREPEKQCQTEETHQRTQYIRVSEGLRTVKSDEIELTNTPKKRRDKSRSLFYAKRPSPVDTAFPSEEPRRKSSHPPSDPPVAPSNNISPPVAPSNSISRKTKEQGVSNRVERKTSLTGSRCVHGLNGTEKRRPQSSLKRALSGSTPTLRQPRQTQSSMKRAFSDSRTKPQRSQSIGQQPSDTNPKAKVGSGAQQRNVLPSFKPEKARQTTRQLRGPNSRLNQVKEEPERKSSSSQAVKPRPSNHARASPMRRSATPTESSLLRAIPQITKTGENRVSEPKEIPPLALPRVGTIASPTNRASSTRCSTSRSASPFPRRRNGVAPQKTATTPSRPSSLKAAVSTNNIALKPNAATVGSEAHGRSTKPSNREGNGSSTTPTIRSTAPTSKIGSTTTRKPIIKTKKEPVNRSVTQRRNGDPISARNNTVKTSRQLSTSKDLTRAQTSKIPSYLRNTQSKLNKTAKGVIKSPTSTRGKRGSAPRRFFSRPTPLHNFSATIIEKYVRMYTKRMLYTRMRASALLVQRCYRMHAARSAVVGLLCASRKFKALTGRSGLGKAGAGGDENAVHGGRFKIYSAQMIQKWYRMAVVRSDFLELRYTAMVVQRWYRNAIWKRCLRCKAALVIQRKLRMHGVRSAFLELRSAVRKIQKWRRRTMQRRNGAAVTIQKTLRMNREKNKQHHLRRATIVLQSWFRMAIKRSAFLIQHRTCAANFIQSWYRRIIAQLILVNRAAGKIQAHLRAIIIARSYATKRVCSSMIQAACRSYLLRKEYIQLRRAAVAVQSAYRVIEPRKTFVALRVAVVCLQSLFRGISLRKNSEFLRKRREKSEQHFSDALSAALAFVATRPKLLGGHAGGYEKTKRRSTKSASEDSGNDRSPSCKMAFVSEILLLPSEDKTKLKSLSEGPRLANDGPPTPRHFPIQQSVLPELTTKRSSQVVSLPVNSIPSTKLDGRVDYPLGHPKYFSSRQRNRKLPIELALYQTRRRMHLGIIPPDFLSQTEGDNAHQNEEALATQPKQTTQPPEIGLKSAILRGLQKDRTERRRVKSEAKRTLPKRHVAQKSSPSHKTERNHLPKSSGDDNLSQPVTRSDASRRRKATTKKSINALRKYEIPAILEETRETKDNPSNDDSMTVDDSNLPHRCENESKEAAFKEKLAVLQKAARARIIQRWIKVMLIQCQTCATDKVSAEELDSNDCSEGLSAASPEEGLPNIVGPQSIEAYNASSQKIQHAWKIYKSQVALLSRCLMAWSVTFAFPEDLPTNRGLRQQAQLLALDRAYYQIGGAMATSGKDISIQGDAVSAQWQGGVSLDFIADDHRAVQTRCIVTVRCSAVRIFTSNRWGQNKHYRLLIKAAIGNFSDDRSLEVKLNTMFERALTRKHHVHFDDIASQNDRHDSENCAIVIQRAFRSFCRRRRIARQPDGDRLGVPDDFHAQMRLLSAILIQNWYRMRVCRTMYQGLRRIHSRVALEAERSPVSPKKFGSKFFPQHQCETIIEEGCEVNSQATDADSTRVDCEVKCVPSVE